MTRRDMIKTMGAGVGMLAAGPLWQQAAGSDDMTEKPAQPNILFVFTDQQHARLMSCAGDESLKTPAMDFCFAYNAHRQAKSSVADLYAQASALPDDALPLLPANFEPCAGEPAIAAPVPSDKGATRPGNMRRDYTERDWRIYRWIYRRLTDYATYRTAENAELLFDLQDDPGEMKNLVADPALHTVLQQHRAMLKEWCEQTADTMAGEFVRPGVGRERN